MTDAERLDWIGKQDTLDLGWGIVVDAEHDGEFYVANDRLTAYGKTFREAIDAAMQKEAA